MSGFCTSSFGISGFAVSFLVTCKYVIFYLDSLPSRQMSLGFVNNVFPAKKLEKLQLTHFL